MNYELKIIDGLVEKLLKPPKKENSRELINEFDHMRSELDKEVGRIKKAFVYHMFTLEKDKQVERYIQRHQSSLILLCNQLISRISPKEFKHAFKSSEPTSIPTFYFYFYSKLEELLSYIEHYFAKYFNQNEKIPASYSIIGQMEFREKLRSLEISEGCDLVEIALHPIREFLKYSGEATFRKLIYLKGLYSEINEICSQCTKPKDDCKLSFSLVYLNFNSYKYFKYLTTHIQAMFEKEEELTKQIEQLSFHLKQINQTQLKPNTSYKPKHLSIKEQLTIWILEEMSHLEKVHQLSLKFPEKSIEEINSHFKLVTDFSVSQAAYFIRLLIDTGMIQNNNHKQVITFFANHIKSKKADNISPESFRSKFYSVEESTRSFIREKVIGLLNETQKNL